MGWLELLPLLKRALPLLDRLAPMLEATIAGRGAARAELARTVTSTEEMTRAQNDLLRAVELQSAEIAGLSDQIKQLHDEDKVMAESLLSIEEQTSSLSIMLKWLFVLVALLLLVVIVLLVLLLRRGS